MRKILPVVVLAVAVGAWAQEDEAAPESVDEGSAGAEESSESETNAEPAPPTSGDFRPGEEISEDYPVPLPADI